MCRWQDPESTEYRCRVPPDADAALCVFHSPHKKTALFLEKFNEQVNGKGDQDTRNPPMDFRGYIFPEGYGLSLGSSSAKKVVEVPSLSEGDLRLDRAVVYGSIELNVKKLAGRAVLRGARIYGDLVLAEAKIDGDVDASNTRIRRNVSAWNVEIGGNVDFSNSVIEGHVVFRGAICHASVDFRRATIRGDAEFTRTRTDDDLDFRESTVGGHAIFLDAKVAGIGTLSEATIEGSAVFRGAVIRKYMDLTGVQVKGSCNFAFCEASALYVGPARPTILWLLPRREGVVIRHWKTGVSFWEFAERTFQKMGERERADAAYYFGRLWRRRAAMASAGWKRTVVLAGFPLDLFLRWSIAYGASFARTLASWFIVILGFGSVYALVPHLFRGYPDSIWTSSNWASGLFLSASCFAKLTLSSTTVIQSSGKVLLLSESIISSLLVALTIAVIARRVMR